MEQKGVIYILTNPSFPEYVKFGYADDINKRLRNPQHANAQVFCQEGGCSRLHGKERA